MGIGIPQHRINVIFNRFEQSNIEDIKVFEGSGLGFAISKSYAKMLGGNISISSKEGVVSTFTFTMPYIPFYEDNFLHNSREIHKENMEVYWNKLDIIIAEDDKTSRQLFNTLFENRFHSIIYTTTGKETIEKCRENPATDIILMDIKMPVINGFNAAREIRKFNEEIIIITQTADGLADDKKKAIDVGCNDYIAKPINTDE